LAVSQSKDIMPKSDKTPVYNDGMPQKMRPYIFRWLKPSTKLGSGGVIPKSAALGRLVRWPKYVRLQRQRKILLQRLKIPPAIHMFNRGCNKKLAKQIVRFCKNYSPESRKQKTIRLKAQAKLQAEGKPIPDEKRLTITSGLGQVIHSIERGSAQLVCIAHDVDPIELVICMPALCVKKNIPFVIFRAKARLGTLVHKKTCTCIAIERVLPEHTSQLKTLQNKARKLYNTRYNQYKNQWGKMKQGIKTRQRKQKRTRARMAEIKRRKAALS